MAARKTDARIPSYKQLMMPTFKALKELGGSGNNNDILNQIIKDMRICDEVADIIHKGRTDKTELSYRADWARTYLKIYGVIDNSKRGIWSVKPEFVNVSELDTDDIVRKVKEVSAKRNTEKNPATDDTPENDNPSDDDTEFPEEEKPWRVRLSEILRTMDPYGFERLSQRVLRECGFTQVEVTKKSGDGGIDGTGKLRINGIFSFNVAFQCKRYKNQVGAGEIRDFRGSLTTDIEKGVMITTGTFSKAAREEASNPGKQQIDLIDGEEFMNKIAEYGIGVKPVTTYAIDEEFFKKI